MSGSGFAENSLSRLLDLRGPDLIGALVRELESLHREIGSLHRELEALRDYQASRDRWLAVEEATRNAMRLPRSVIIDANQSLDPRYGFYKLEYNKRGVPFCWTGPSPSFSFDVFVDRTNGAELELRAIACVDFQRQKNLQLLVDGEPVPAKVVQGNGGISVTAALPPSRDNRVTNLIFIVPEVLPPANQADSRRLGVAFAWISVTSSGDRPEQSDATAESDGAAKPYEPILLVPRSRERRTLEVTGLALGSMGEGAAVG